MIRNARERHPKDAKVTIRRLTVAMTGLLLIAVAGAALLSYYREVAAEANEFTEIALLVGTPEATNGVQVTPVPAVLTESSVAPDIVSSPEPTAQEPEIPRALERFTELYAQNNELGGWVTIDGTEVNYPVMLTPDDPEKYIQLSFSKKASASGVPFIGEGCTISPRSDNIVLYGHHMKSGAMFAAIVKYQKKEFLQNHPVIHFSTLYDEGDYEIFAVLATDVRKAKALRCYTFLNANDEADFNDYLAGIRQASLYDTGVAVAYGDDLLTLSTCAYHTNDGRFVIIARRK